MKKIKSYYYTIRNLKPIQIAYRFKYILKRKLYQKFGSFFYRRLENRFEADFLPNLDERFVYNLREHYGSDFEKLLHNEIEFLNRTIQFDNRIDWHKDELNSGTRLWKLNLNYHEFLIDVAIRYKESKDRRWLNYIEKTILEWFRQNPLGTKDYGKDNWNSYAISLRLISWIKIYQLIGQEFEPVFKKRLEKSLWIQAHFLRENLEFDILGNHLIKNWKALIWCKHFIATKAFDSQLIKLDKYIYRQFSEHIMHEELSPMYTGIVLEDLMEVLLFEPSDRLEQIVTKQYFALQLLSNNGQYAFFNDSINANGVQMTHIEEFYSKLFSERNEKIAIDSFFDLGGYVGIKNKREHIIVDGAPVVAGKQPGHIHCDALSFEYFLDGNKVFTNSGVYEYNQGRRRTYSRATESHNTLKYAQYDQCEVWSSFRVARQAKVRYEVNTIDEESFEFEGYIAGFDFKNKVNHRRLISKSPKRIVITDTLNTNQKEEATIFFHLHPEFHFEGNQIMHVESSKIIGEIKVSESSKTINTEFYPEFGKMQEKQTLIIEGICSDVDVKTEIIIYE